MTTWKKGDLAVCIADGWHYQTGHDPKTGDVLRVAVCGLYYDEMALGFEGKPLRQGWNADAFRKAEPDDKPCDAGFLDMIGAK